MLERVKSSRSELARTRATCTQQSIYVRLAFFARNVKRTSSDTVGGHSLANAAEEKKGRERERSIRIGESRSKRSCVKSAGGHARSEFDSGEKTPDRFRAIRRALARALTPKSFQPPRRARRPGRRRGRGGAERLPPRAPVATDAMEFNPPPLLR